jgi:hypothetical protein
MSLNEMGECVYAIIFRGFGMGIILAQDDEYILCIEMDTESIQTEMIVLGCKLLRTKYLPNGESIYMNDQGGLNSRMAYKM